MLHAAAICSSATNGAMQSPHMTKSGTGTQKSEAVTQLQVTAIDLNATVQYAQHNIGQNIFHAASRQLQPISFLFATWKLSQLQHRLNSAIADAKEAV